MSSSNLETYLRSFRSDAELHSFQEPIQGDLSRMQQLLREFFRSRIPLISEVGDHLLAMSGKRFRPALDPPDRPPEAESRFAIRSSPPPSIELIHTATLVHDDTIDKSALRRGLPTINALYNDLVATILGDYIYTKASRRADRSRQRIRSSRSWRERPTRCRSARCCRSSRSATSI